ncbi:MAG: hypothetical protein HYW15_03055 [Candidatus Giovannonibacteria bacterium]|nr:MAG: hypothetical protein HYW15_03055 [Candidatus Giovannonibacteria bacterium]
MIVNTPGGWRIEKISGPGIIARHGGTPAFTQGYGGQAAGTSEGKKRNKR